MITCFKCSKSFEAYAVNTYIKHLKHDHLLHDNDSLYCGMQSCYRIYNNFNSFRKHLNTHNFKSQNLKSHNLNISETVNKPYDFHEGEVSRKREPQSENLNSNICSVVDNNLETDILAFISAMYSNSLVPRKFIQFVINKIEVIFCKNLIPALKKVVMANLDQNNPNFADLNKSFEVIENCFSDFNSEYKCLKVFKESALFVDSQNVQIGETMKKQQNLETGVTLEPSPVFMKLLSVKDLLSKIFSIPNFFKSMVDYYNELEKETTVISNFIQCCLWKSLITSYDKKIVFPLMLIFDDYEVGNALGSHAGTNKLGAIYLTLPSMPPHMISKLNNIFLIALFYSNDRKTFGNKIFSNLITELRYLQERGISVSKNETIYFKISLISGDNLGIHSLLGFTESFSCAYSCRFCKATKQLSHVMTVEDDALMRTVANYNEDVLTNDVSKTGIKEECVFHQLPGFHVTTNFTVDIMHDLLEGVCIYDLSYLLKVLVLDYKFLSLETLNSRIQLFNYCEIVNSNKPPVITLDRLKSTLKMSASEMLCLTRYLGLMIGDLVPLNFEIWELYIILREIIDITTAFHIHCKTFVRLKVLVEEHNSLYVKFCGNLKPKFHHLIHYHKILQMSGPLRHIWCMRAEQKHRESKLTANVSCSFRNLLETLMLKSQLRLGYLINNSFRESEGDSFGPILHLPTDFYETYFGDLDKKSLFTSCWINHLGTNFKPNFVLILDISGDMPVFGVIQEIVLSTTTIVNDE